MHRIGRTGRAGTPGHAVSLVSSDENAFLRDIGISRDEVRGRMSSDRLA